MRLMQVISDYIRRSILTIVGDLVVRGAAQPERLASGAAGTYLMGQGAGVIPAYVAPPTIPACRATLSANQSIASGVWTKINLDGTDYDTTNDFDAVNYKWVCSQTGKYLISVNLQILDLPDTKVGSMSIKVDGTFRSPHARLYTGGSGHMTFGSTDVLSLTVDDEVTVFGLQTSGVNKDVRGGSAQVTWLTLHRLS